MQLSSNFYIGVGSLGFCDERCYRNYLIMEKQKAIEDKNKFLREKNDQLQETINGLNTTNTELSEKVKELEKEIQIRNEGIDNFMHLNLD